MARNPPRARIRRSTRRASILISCLAVAACQPAVGPVAAAGAVEAASVTVFGRGSFDMAYSAVSGRDCSIVRLDRGESYCKPKETAPPPQPFCTRTLGMAECFADPAALPDHPTPLADGPAPALPARKRPKY